MKLKEYLFQLNQDLVVDLRKNIDLEDYRDVSPDRSRICICSTDSEGIKPFADKEVVCWGKPMPETMAHMPYVDLMFVLKID